MSFRSFLARIVLAVVLAGTAGLAQAQQVPQPAVPAAEQKPAPEAAVAAAEAWLDFVDRGDYRASWEQGAQMLRTTVTLPEWAHSLVQADAKTGPVQERMQAKAWYTTEMPGAPAGEYVVVRYWARYDNLEAIEGVVLVREEDGWKVAGYKMQPANS